jgi:sugar phosphate isomerase/epimerase
MTALTAKIGYPPLGLQPIVFGGTYDTKDPEQLDAFLEVVAEAGYGAIEFNPPDPALFVELALKYGIAHAGLHIAISGGTDMAAHIETLQATGAKDVCNSGLLTWGSVTLEDYEASIAVLNRVGRQFRDAGIAFHYHNHAFEFEKIDGELRGVDLLLSELDPDAVDLCVDVAWVYRGGDDPAEFLARHADRIGYLHLKDTHSGEAFAELGRGVLDFDGIMRVIPTLPRVRWAMVEQDNTKLAPEESITISRDFLTKRYGW